MNLPCWTDNCVYMEAFNHIVGNRIISYTCRSNDIYSHSAATAITILRSPVMHVIPDDRIIIPTTNNADACA